MGKRSKKKEQAEAAAKYAAVGGKAGKKKKKPVRETIEAIIIALVLALVIRAFCVQAFKIPSSSMEDTLLIGDHILVSKFAYGMQVPRPAMITVMGMSIPFFETQLKPVWGSIERGDVIVFRFPGDRTKDYIKRVVGTPGDKVEVKDKRIFINGKFWDDKVGVFKGSQGGRADMADNFGPYTVPEGKVFVMGDNRDRSFDSRFWGPVSINDIKGKAFIIYFSWDHNGGGVRFSRFASSIK
ncbi:Signal peptidase I [hydrothermal vent metagenome]|uniref:signal peptidase I n=1 Tax=hydrothermal vent metagenome TaxID=652676 RepID=A0A3B0RGL0_9ZZZZ